MMLPNTLRCLLQVVHHREWCPTLLHPINDTFHGPDQSRHRFGLVVGLAVQIAGHPDLQEPLVDSSGPLPGKANISLSLVQTG